MKEIETAMETCFLLHVFLPEHIEAIILKSQDHFQWNRKILWQIVFCEV